MASKAGPVEIVVDIVDQFSDELKELNAKLEKIDKKKITVDFEIDSEGEIKKVKAQLQQLKKQINTNLDIDTQGAAKAQAVKTALSKDMHSTLHIDRDSAGNIPPPRLLGTDARDAVQRASKGSIDRAMRDAGVDARFPSRAHPHRAEGLVDAPSLKGPTQRRGGWMDRPSIPSSVGNFFEGRRGFLPSPDFGRIDPDMALTGPRGLDTGFDPELFGRQSRRRLRKLAGTLDKLRPNIMMVWNALAALIPVFITLGAAAIGLAGGMIAIASAGAAILGLGLLGWGDSFGSSIENLTQQARKLGSNLFDVMQPAARTAQPIMQDWMEGAPRQIQKLVGPLEDLMLAFDGTLGQIGAGMVDWVVRVVESMTAMEGIISQITLRFGGIAGDFLIDFMENMVRFAYENQDALIRVSSALRDIFGILLDLSIVIVRVLAVLQPLIAAFKLLTGLLSNRWVAAAIAMITTLILLQTALASVTSMSAAASVGIIAMAKGAISTYITAITGAISQTYAWIVSLGALRGALMATGIGALVVGAGMIASSAMSDFNSSGGGRPGGGGMGGAGGTNIVVQGDVEKRQMDRLLDEVPKASRNERNTSNQMDL